MSQFTTHIPPPILFGTPTNSTRTRPAHGLTPSSVGSWIGFIEHLWDENILLDRDAFFIDSSIVCNEAGVRRFFDSNILNNLQYCIERAIPGRHLKFVPEQQIPGSGIPDYAYGYPRFFIELETPWNISGDLVKQYNNKKKKSMHHARHQASFRVHGGCKAKVFCSIHLRTNLVHVSAFYTSWYVINLKLH